MPPHFDTTAYRYPSEYGILTLTLLLVFLVIALTATATFCASVVFVALAVVLAYYSTRAHHHALLHNASPVDQLDASGLEEMITQCMQRLQARNVQIFVARSSDLNAYTFGLSNPKVVVLYSSLFKVMDRDELAFILGHELGHVRLGHTWLNSLVGGLAGIPSPSSAFVILSMVFLWWNRACEYSADRAGLLACGDPGKAITALVKLVAGPRGLTHQGLELAYRQIDAEDDTFLGSLGEALGSHPLLIRRINQLRGYAASPEYRRLQNLVNQNSG